MHFEENIILKPRMNKILDTDRIQKAIDFASNERKRLIFEEGVYYTGTLYLKNNSWIRLNEGCVIIGSDNVGEYTVTEYCHQSKQNYWQSVFFGKNIENVTICGKGKIQGQGDKFPFGLEAFSANDYDQSPVQEFKIRPSLLYLKHCQNITLANLSFEDAAQFAILIEESKDILIDGINILNRKNRNTDGIHFSQNYNIHIKNCKIDSGDDVLVFNRGVSKLQIENCDVTSRWAGIRFGPFSDGDFSDIEVSHCWIHDTYGCAIKIQIGQGGHFRNVNFHDMDLERVTGPIHINLCHIPHWESEKIVSENPGSIENVIFKRIKASTVAKPYPLEHEVAVSEGELFSCINIQGLKDYPIKKLVLSDWDVCYEAGYQDPQYKLHLLEKIDYRYPEYFMFGIMPCYAFYGSHIDEIVMENVRFYTERYDIRTPMILNDVTKMKQENVCIYN